MNYSIPVSYTQLDVYKRQVYYRVFNITEDKFVNEIGEEISIEDNKIGMGAAAVRNGEIFIITDYINDTDGNQEYFVNIYDKQLEFKKKVPIDALGNFILHGGYGEMGIWEYFIYGDYLIFEDVYKRQAYEYKTILSIIEFCVFIFHEYIITNSFYIICIVLFFEFTLLKF